MKIITFPSSDKAIACFPPECTATALITNWLRPGICRGKQTLPQKGMPNRPPLLSPQTNTYIYIYIKILLRWKHKKNKIKLYTFPSFEIINSDFDPPIISIGLSEVRISLKVGLFILDPFNPPSCPLSFKPQTYTAYSEFTLILDSGWGGNS